ncbi:TonB-dependent receptor [Erythrobacter sp. HI0063]|mgnify:CR=1 FL=1|jgi:outer membrane receptor protein involved in Fe transport|uniref:TonB-dependent receptor domain-containing protein n=1 Tax=Erythrobacter sp. HI0063 TaxID=1822240 RepID=UPI0007C24E80|nr:TonB-dependent receptor [Erythrobacter sp. HI0063]KZY58330.1 TonB-dependent receptor [Erythrobacter sp. HI0063]
MKIRHTLALSAALSAFAMPAMAQDAATSEEDPPVIDASEIVVTAVARGQNVLDSSVSVSSIDSEALVDLAPRSSAELIRQIPGIRSESSGGDGNANIAVRGLPVASGGAKFLQLQEDGLPILEFGDITFGNADIFLRTDYSVARVEAVRGGSASTFASNSPGGVINFISKTGTREGGSLGLTAGLDYREFRADFDYGGSIDDNTDFHIGGFSHIGDGPRDVGYDGSRGGQIKANITRNFANGYVRVYGKYLNDHSVAYLPNPVFVTGSDADPTYTSIANFSINSNSLHSRNFRPITTLDQANQVQTYNIDEGMHPKVLAGGFEAEFDVGGFTVTNRFRYADISGAFVSPFPGSVTGAQAAADAIGGPSSSLFYATGPQAGQIVANPASLGGNGLVANIVTFNTRLNSLDNLTNDLRATTEFDVGGGSASLTGGFYYSQQDIDTAWLWTSHLMSVQGDGDAVLLDVRNAAGVPQTQNGTVGYSAAFFGNCCRRSYDLEYTTKAPFAALGLEFGGLSLDGSIRWDFSEAKGRTFGDGPVTTRDINGNGAINRAETLVSVLPTTGAALVDYDTDYLSYSVGANYLVSDSFSIFGRYSRGGRANADRILFNANNIDPATGELRNSDVAVDFVKQAEIGVKYRAGGLSFYATAFDARTEEENFEATTQTVFSRAYKARGVELEGSYRMGPFSLSGGATYTDAEIDRDNISPANVGNMPRRQADWIYQATAAYDSELFGLGVNAVGTSDSYAQDSNQLVLLGFTAVNAFVNLRPADGITLSLNANNVFDVEGFTEAEEGAIPANGIVRARSINGRTLSASVRFDF